MNTVGIYLAWSELGKEGCERGKEQWLDPRCEEDGHKAEEKGGVGESMMSLFQTH